MNIFKKIYCRTYQFCFRLALPLLPYRQPKILESNKEVVEVLKNSNLKNVFLVTDKTIRGLGLTTSLENTLTNNNINVVVFDRYHREGSP